MSGGADLDAGGPNVVVISETTSDTINASSSEYYPSSAGLVVDTGYRLITISVKADYALTGAVEVSDDYGTTWDQYYPADGTTFTLTAGRLKSMSYEEDFLMVRLKLDNGDGSNHTVNSVRFKGNRY